MNLPRWRLPPWEADRERRALLPPMDLRERLRLALKVGAVGLAFLWFKEQELQGGAAAACAFAAAVGALSLIELVWLQRSGPRERVFTSTRGQAVALHAVTVLLAAASLVAAAARLP